ncbi:2Fe-2S iron-sulfur cluster-binding protein [Ralstonia soli]|uniref:2Fe-2S iron-sulfur cluster-binding protein n=1 Tax=Ralstonia soli TaxID=2953896 RepID=A0ABT1AEB2_9RALS|nr:2Fe-2S iron-sulfur cluster-binding protein [Ralstonia soli]MCO5396676.1 2Fe-2S iron-sulfur cluster-binding protein [Ralstonia soli]
MALYFMKIVNVLNGAEFEAHGDVDVVSASIQAHCTVSHSCRRGVCGQCAGLVRDGAFSNGIEGTTQTVSRDGKPVSVLMCQTFARSDLTIECADNDSVAPTRAVQVTSIEFPTPEVAVIDLRFMDERPFEFQAGQFVAIRWTGDRQKYFSIASNANGSKGIQLHIRRQAHGEFTGWLFEAARAGDIFGLEGPLGRFTWSTPDARPVVLMATGTGFSPIQSLVETHELWARQSPVYLYWGGQTENDVYRPEVARQWSAMGRNFHFIPVAAAPLREWAGRIGYLQECVAQDHPNLTGYDVYACGSPIMIARAQERLIGDLGLPSERFFTDSFNVTPPQTTGSGNLVDFTVKFQGSAQGRIHAEGGRTLLQALMRAGLDLDHYCGGGAVCGTCRVSVEPALLAGMNEAEADLLECLPSTCDEHRLACQFQLSQDIESRTVYLPGTPGRVSALED